MRAALLVLSALLSALCAACDPAQQAAESRQENPDAPPPVMTIAAPEADQGVASDGTHVYAVDNNLIGKYDIATGKRVAYWEGDPARFPHMNSCTVAGRDLICAASNYPAVPHTSRAEIFSLEPLTHVRTVELDSQAGSLTVLDRHADSWWAVFANYDGKGGIAGRGHQYTRLLELDDEFREVNSWRFPQEVLARFAPYSCSGASWGADGYLYASGHDRPEIYKLAVPETGDTLRLVAIQPVTSEGQAIDWDPSRRELLWSISRDGKSLIATPISQNPDCNEICRWWQLSLLKVDLMFHHIKGRWLPRG